MTRFKLIESASYGFVLMHRCDNCGTYHAIHATLDFAEALAVVCVANQIGHAYDSDDPHTMMRESAGRN